MGCNQSKANAAVPPSGGVAPTPKSSAGPKRTTSPLAKKDPPLPPAHPAMLYHHLLGGLAPTAPGEGPRARAAAFWDDARGMTEAASSLAAYVDPDTIGAPLHVACSLGSAQVDEVAAVRSALACLATLIDACPTAVQQRDKHGHVPLEGLFVGLRAGIPDGAWRFRTEAARALLDAEPRAVPLRGDMLYKIVEALPDDACEPLGPTVGLMAVLADEGGATVHGSAAPGDNASSTEDNASSLALLYRRFVRQFDQSERFFEGDNSREEVVQHRARFKNAAVNTFNIIELLLRRPGGEREAADDLLIHNAVRAGTCPPDLLRYIVETNLEAVAQVDARGNLPLHYAAGPAPPGLAAPESYSKYVIDELLYAHPEGASVANANSVLPIVLAIESGKKWIGGGIRSLHEAYPPGIEYAQLAEQHPLINALSFQSQEDDEYDSCRTTDMAEEPDDREGSIAMGVDGSGGRRRKRRQRRRINKDESHDAIMLVQRPGAPVRDVVTTMWANEEDGGVQMLGCAALALAAAEAGAAGVALLGVTAVVNAMKNHPNEPAVQEQACAALAALAPADGAREVSFAAAGAISTAVGALQAHLADRSVQREACRALRGIAAAGGAERATVTASAGGFTALVNAIEAHPGDRAVQAEACAALAALTSFREAYLPELPAQTEALLRSAARRFPDDCLEHTNAICSRLNRLNECE